MKKVLLSLSVLSLSTLLLAWCTNTPAVDDEIIDEENVVATYDENSWKEIISEDCVNFFDWCNNCTRVEGEDGAACTRMYCETYEEPRCTDDEQVVIENDEDLNEDESAEFVAVDEVVETSDETVEEVAE